MTETDPPPDETMDTLRARATALEAQLQATTENADARVIRAELKAEALRAGMIDLDGLKLVDPAEVKLNIAGEVEGAAALMARLKRAKPWLFTTPSTSAAATAPPAQPPRAKRATEMTEAEYRTARADLLRRR